MSIPGPLRPGVPDLVFGIVLAMGLAGGPSRFLNDPGTFWHVRLGREIARTGHVPRMDTLTYTRDGTPWVDQSWAFDLGLAALVDRSGWSGPVAVAIVGLAWLYGALARGLLRDGSSPMVALAVSVVAAGIGSIHFLARPHLLSLAFALWTLRACRAYHEYGSWVVWTIPLATAAWANLHGGFLAAPVIVATAGAGHAASGAWDRTRRRRLLGFAAVFLLTCAAPLANPYGVGLYRHVINLMITSHVTGLITEYQPLAFGTAEAHIMEGVILALVVLPAVSRSRPTRYDLAHALVWLHLALGTARYAPLFALAVAPTLARLLDGLRDPNEGEEAGPPPARWSAWPLAASLAMVAAVGGGVHLGGPDPGRWPLAALPVLDRQPIGARLFHEQDWGGMIEALCRPGRRTFLDDRFELFGREMVLEYGDALQGGPGWDALLARRAVGLVWVRPSRGLARRLLSDPRWEVLHRDGVSVLFRRRESGAGRAAKSAPSP